MDERSTDRITPETKITAAVIVVVLLLAFIKAKPMTYAFVGGAAVTLVVFLALHLWLDARMRPRTAAAVG